MLCLACASPADGLCEPCVRSLRPVSCRYIGGIEADAPFLHAGAAAVLVRGLKYQGNLRAGRYLADRMVRCLPADPTCLVPVPRSGLRLVRYGIDPAAVLAGRLAEATGVPVLPALRAPVWWPRRAGGGLAVRGAIEFSRRLEVPEGAVLVDDVLTTGATVASAARALGSFHISVVTATSVGTMEGGADRVRAQEVALRRSDRASHFGPPMRQTPVLRIQRPTDPFTAAPRSRREEDG